MKSTSNSPSIEISQSSVEKQKNQRISFDDLDQFIKYYSTYGLRLITVYGLDANGHCSCSAGGSCSTPGKHPMRYNWQKAVRVTNPHKFVLETLMDMNNNPFNIGIVGGSTREIIDPVTSEKKFQHLLIIDIDVENHPLFDLYYKNSSEKTFCVKTGKGYHLYYYSKYRYGNYSRIIPHLDIKGKNGFVVAPPSHHQSGIQYLPLDLQAKILEIPSAFEKALWDAINGKEIDIPGILTDTFAQEQTEHQKQSYLSVLGLTAQFLASIPKDLFEAECKKTRHFLNPKNKLPTPEHLAAAYKAGLKVPQGCRNTTLFRVLVQHSLRKCSKPELENLLDIYHAGYVEDPASISNSELKSLLRSAIKTANKLRKDYSYQNFSFSMIRERYFIHLKKQNTYSHLAEKKVHFIDSFFFKNLKLDFTKGAGIPMSEIKVMFSKLFEIAGIYDVPQHKIQHIGEKLREKGAHNKVMRTKKLSGRLWTLKPSKKLIRLLKEENVALLGLPEELKDITIIRTMNYAKGQKLASTSTQRSGNYPIEEAVQLKKKIDVVQSTSSDYQRIRNYKEEYANFVHQRKLRQPLQMSRKYQILEVHNYMLEGKEFVNKRTGHRIMNRPFKSRRSAKELAFFTEQLQFYQMPIMQSNVAKTRNYQELFEQSNKLDTPEESLFKRIVTKIYNNHIGHLSGHYERVREMLRRKELEKRLKEMADEQEFIYECSD